MYHFSYTAVGKSETAYQLSTIISAKHTQVGSTRRYLPDGLLTIRGEDFSTSVVSISQSNSQNNQNGNKSRRIEQRQNHNNTDTVDEDFNMKLGSTIAQVSLLPITVV